MPYPVLANTGFNLHRPTVPRVRPRIFRRDLRLPALKPQLHSNLSLELGEKRPGFLFQPPTFESGLLNALLMQSRGDIVGLLVLRKVGRIWEIRADTNLAFDRRVAFLAPLARARHSFLPDFRV
jgi:hypothetical protein